MSFSLLCAFYWHLVRQTETGYSNFTLALSVAKQGRTLLLFYSTPILAGFKAIFIFGDAALLPFISRETSVRIEKNDGQREAERIGARKGGR